MRNPCIDSGAVLRTPTHGELGSWEAGERASKRVRCPSCGRELSVRLVKSWGMNEPSWTLPRHNKTKGA